MLEPFEHPQVVAEQARHNTSRTTRRNITAASGEEDVPESPGPCLVDEPSRSEEPVWKSNLSLVIDATYPYDCVCSMA